MRLNKQTEIENKITHILWADWDPIGCGVPEDEYESYTPRIYQALSENCNAYFLTQILVHVSENIIGNKNPDWYKAVMVAEKLITTFQKEIIELKDKKWIDRMARSNKRKTFPLVRSFTIFRGEKKAGDPYNE